MNIYSFNKLKISDDGFYNLFEKTIVNNTFDSYEKLVVSNDLDGRLDLISVE